MTTIRFDSQTPTADALGFREVLVVLVDGGAGGSTGDVIIGTTARVKLDADGTETVDLVPNDEITPEGTFYRCTLAGASPKVVRLIQITGDTPDGTSWADPSIQVVDISPPSTIPVDLVQIVDGKENIGVAAGLVAAEAVLARNADNLNDGTTKKAFLATERTKLAGIATGATANATNAALRDRATHTGEQPAETVTVDLPDYSSTIDDLFAAAPSLLVRPGTTAEVVAEVYESGLNVIREVDAASLINDLARARASFTTVATANLAANEVVSNGQTNGLIYGAPGKPAGGFGNIHNVYGTVLNSSRAENEVGGIISAQQVGTDLTNQTPVSFWGASFTLRSPVGVRPGFMGGITAVMQNYYDGSGSRSPSYGFAAVTYPGIGDGADFWSVPGEGIRFADTYEIDYGSIVSGSTGEWPNGGEVSYRVAYKAGGWATPWRGDHDPADPSEVADALADWSPKIGTGFDVSDWVDTGLIIHPPHPDADPSVDSLIIEVGDDQTGDAVVVRDDSDDLAGIRSDGRIYGTTATAPDDLSTLAQTVTPAALAAALAAAATPEDWTIVNSLSSSWTKPAGGDVRYYKHNGLGHLNIPILTGGTNGSTVFTLPAGYRPSSFESSPVLMTADGTSVVGGSIVINTNGTVQINFGNPALPVCLGAAVTWRIP